MWWDASVVHDVWSTMFNRCYKTEYTLKLKDGEQYHRVGEHHVTTLWGKH